MCKHILNAQVAVRAPCCRKWFDCPECHAEEADHPLQKTIELVFACKKCKKVFRKDSTLGAHHTVENSKVEIPFPHKDRFHNFINHLHGTEDLCVTVEQALVVQRILDALAESARTGGSVKL